jgi:hypothetical protein
MFETCYFSPEPISLNPLTFICSLNTKAVCIGIVHWILLMLMLLILREVLTLLPLESSGYQCQDGIKHQLQLQHFSVPLLGDTQILLHILQGVKASM